jgi:hypothetical protein
MDQRNELLTTPSNNKKSLEIISLMKDLDVPFVEIFTEESSQPQLIPLNLNYTLVGAKEIKNYINNFYNPKDK